MRIKDEMNHIIKENPYLPFDKRKLGREKPKKKKGGFGRITIDPADALFSIYIRMRDGHCVRCGRSGKPDSFGRPIKGLECSHYFGRGAETTRFDELNGDAACSACHKLWESKEKEEYRAFKVKQLGENGFQALVLRSHLTGNKDRKMALLYWRGRLWKDFGVRA